MVWPCTKNGRQTATKANYEVDTSGKTKERTTKSIMDERNTTIHVSAKPTTRRLGGPKGLEIGNRKAKDAINRNIHIRIIYIPICCQSAHTEKGSLV